MESSDEEAGASGVLKAAYSFSDMLDALDDTTPAETKPGATCPDNTVDTKTTKHKDANSVEDVITTICPDTVGSKTESSNSSVGDDGSKSSSTSASISVIDSSRAKSNCVSPDPEPGTPTTTSNSSVTTTTTITIPTTNTTTSNSSVKTTTTTTDLVSSAEGGKDEAKNVVSNGKNIVADRSSINNSLASTDNPSQKGSVKSTDISKSETPPTKQGKMKDTVSLSLGPGDLGEDKVVRHKCDLKTTSDQKETNISKEPLSSANLNGKHVNDVDVLKKTDPQKATLKDDNKNAKQAQDGEEKKDSDSEGHSMKDDPIWKRKRVVKKRRKNGSKSSLESDSSLSTNGSFDGDVSLEQHNIADETSKIVINTNDISAVGTKVTPEDGYEPVEYNGKSTDPKTGDDIYENVPRSEMFRSVAGRNDPRRSTLRRGATLSNTATLDMTYKDSQKLVKVLPDDLPLDNEYKEDRSGSRRDRDGVYESIALPAPLSPDPLSPQPNEDDDDYDSWGSSEFESYDEDEPQEESQEPILVTVQVRTNPPRPPSNQNVLNKWAAKIGPRSRSRSEDAGDEANTYLEVTLNMDRHPPPELPPLPPNLTPAQTKRRLIVGSIVESERSYTDSLRRIIEDYQKPLLMAKPMIISKDHIKTIFYRISDILQCHNMFHIELAECIKVWDTEEKVGNVFTASFSKSMVFDVYSEFVNNFTIALETAKKLTKQKQPFADFLKKKIGTSVDKLSLFGLMVKPVQRFPQFILCLQDLLKHTDKDHHDRLALQLALTELETLTHKLNEMKRESENRHEVKKVLSHVTGRFSLKHNPHRCMVRQDDMLQFDCSTSLGKSKPRRLFMLNDQLICSTVIQKDGDTGLAEKFKYKWSVNVRDVTVVESDVPDLYHVKGRPGRSLIVAPKLDQSTFSPWKKELDDMMHDLPIIEEISRLTSQLRLDYKMLTPDLVFGIQRDLHLNIQDQADVDKCILHLSIPNKAARLLHTFQVQSASIKQDWLLELKNAKLALDKNNKPGWYVPETEQALCTRLPLFVKPLLLDITKQQTKIECAIPVMFPSPTNPYLGMQHLWVCSNEVNRGQVTVVALHSSQPHVIESFTACDAPILCAEFVPGLASYDHVHAFPQDTVWMAMQSNELCVRSVVEDNRESDPLLTIDIDDTATCLRFMDGRLYIGFQAGDIAIYTRDNDGVWQIEDALMLTVGDGPVTSMLPLNHQMWVACRNKVHVVNVTSRWRAGIIKQDLHQSGHEVGGEGEEISCMVKAGAGLMVALKGCGVIRIFNQENFHHLQDINIASSVMHILEGKELGELKINPRDVWITSMLASKGLLWVGTSTGCTLTLPLPRLEGLPNIKGRPSVSYHSHLGPIKFITPIHCGASQLHTAQSLPPSANQSRIFHPDGRSLAESLDSHEPTGSSDTPSLVVEGVSKSDTECDGDTEEQVEEEEEEEIVGDEEIEDPRDDVLSRLVATRGRMDNLSTSMLNINQQAMLGKTKWLSTPDLRHTDLTSSEEDVQSLYNNLLSGTDYQHMDVELMEVGRRKRRPVSDLPSPSLVDEAIRMMSERGGGERRSSKRASLPVLLEDVPVHSMDLGGPEHEAGPHDVSNTGSTATQRSLSTCPSTDTNSFTSSTYSPGVSRTPSFQPRPQPTATPKNTNKSIVIVSGGEGHINWAEKNAGDTKYDDICLLLWQCSV